MASSELPLLWHIPISHYSEKVRWALDFKRIPHRRRVAQPGLHPLFALLLTRGQSYTAPLLELDGRVVGDSTAIVASLEAGWPEAPKLYPDDAGERTRALELEDWFDEQVGPPARLWAFTEICRAPESLAEVAEVQMRTLPGPTPPFSDAILQTFVGRRYGAGVAERAEQARQAVVAGFDRLDAELEAGGGEFLVGERFGIADLTAAALLYPIVQPPEGPWQLQAVPEPVREFQASQSERPGWRWVEETWRRCRWPQPAPSAAGAVAANV